MKYIIGQIESGVERGDESSIHESCGTIIHASDEYYTHVTIKLPSGQSLWITVSPDYMDEPNVQIALSE